MIEVQNRWVPLTGATNVRDLGGYDVGTTSTRWQSLYRADNLHRLTDDDQQLLLSAGVRTVIDLRHRDEVDAAPNVLATHPQVCYYNIPVFRSGPAVTGEAIPDLPAVYRFMVDHCQVGFGEALVAIAAAEEGAVLFHCTAGKDRTGILTALLLGLAEVAPKDIAGDYALTTEAMARLRPAILEQVRQRGGDVEATERLLSSDAADMLTLLDYINTQYGSIAQYVQTLGLSDGQINSLRSRLIATG
jgi:protein-tyrosine phosphatase